MNSVFYIAAIENGDVYMFDNPSGCNLIGGLVFKNLFTNPAEQRFHNSLDMDLPIVDSSLNETCQSSNSGALVGKKNFTIYLMPPHLPKSGIIPLLLRETHM